MGKAKEDQQLVFGHFVQLRVRSDGPPLFGQHCKTACPPELAATLEAPRQMHRSGRRPDRDRRLGSRLLASRGRDQRGCATRCPYSKQRIARRSTRRFLPVLLVSGRLPIVPLDGPGAVFAYARWPPLKGGKRLGQSSHGARSRQASPTSLPLLHRRSLRAISQRRTHRHPQRYRGHPRRVQASSEDPSCYWRRLRCSQRWRPFRRAHRG